MRSRKLFVSTESAGRPGHRRHVVRRADADQGAGTDQSPGCRSAGPDQGALSRQSARADQGAGAGRRPRPPEPTKAPEATKAPAAAAAKVNNPPKTAAEVDAIDLKGKNVTVTYWHNRPQKDQDFLQGMLDEFNKSNPYGITAKAEIAGASLQRRVQQGQRRHPGRPAARAFGGLPEPGCVLPQPGRRDRPDPVRQEQEVRPERGRREGLLPGLPRQRREPAVQGRACWASRPSARWTCCTTTSTG